jgi:subtilisin family serine protease
MSLAVVSLAVAACADSTGTDGAPLARFVGTGSAVLTPELVPNEYVVALKRADRAGVASEANRIRALGGLVTHEWSEGFVGLAIRIPASKLEAVRRSPAVEFVQASQIFKADAQVPCLNPGSLGGCPWGWDRVSDRSLPLNNLKAQYPFKGQGVTFYSIDTGVNPAHTEWTGRYHSLWDAIDNDADASDLCNGHGSHTTSTAIGTNYGFATMSHVWAVRVLDCAGNGTTVTVIDGVNRVTAHHTSGPAVANMSLGGGADAGVDAAVTASIADGIVYAVSAGNSNFNACSFSPARVPNAETIGATGNDPGFGTPPAFPDQRASYSNFGSCLDGFAPGTNILGAYVPNPTSAAIAQGTSMASPHVAGAALVWLSQHPTRTPAQFHTAVWNYSTKNVVTNPGAGSPNNLLHNSIPSVAGTP